MSYQKPRILNDYRDLLFSLIPLVLIAVVFAGLASQCSFSATGPTPGQVPTFDVAAALRSDARTLSFPIREPALPDTWKANSGSRDTFTEAGGGTVSSIGYLTAGGAYLQLNQSDATEEVLVRHLADTRVASGTEQVGQRTWVVYAEPDVEPAWVSDFGKVRVLIRGAGDVAEFTTLARAMDAAAPLAE